MNEQPKLIHVILGFAAVYIIWGSTYLGIAYAIETIPPFLMSGLRFLSAGVLLFAIAKLKKVKVPPRKEIINASISGILLLVGGNMSVAWAEQYIPSSIAAIVIASLPIWLVALDKQQWKKITTDPLLIIGLIIGFAGVAFLIGFDEGFKTNDSGYLVIAFIVLISAPIFWSSGTIFMRSAKHPNNSFARITIQMLSSGVVTILVSLFSGETIGFQFGEVSLVSWAALAYLVFFGTIIAFSAYIWLVGVKPPAQVGTYAYVNPIVATLLGWFFRDEPITVQTILALFIILSGVFMVNYSFAVQKRKEIKRQLEST
ncbi:MAG: EamA family transporter [Bacteroidota bacterium]